MFIILLNTTKMETLKVKLSKEESEELIKKFIDKIDINNSDIEGVGIDDEFHFHKMEVKFSISFYTEPDKTLPPDISIPKWRSVTFSWMMINNEGNQVEVESDVSIDDGVMKEFEV